MSWVVKKVKGWCGEKCFQMQCNIFLPTPYLLSSISTVSSVWQVPGRLSGGLWLHCGDCQSWECYTVCLSRGWQITVEFPGCPRHWSSIQHNVVVNSQMTMNPDCSIWWFQFSHQRLSLFFCKLVLTLQKVNQWVVLKIHMYFMFCYDVISFIQKLYSLSTVAQNKSLRRKHHSLCQKKQVAGIISKVGETFLTHIWPN